MKSKSFFQKFVVVLVFLSFLTCFSLRTVSADEHNTEHEGIQTYTIIQDGDPVEGAQFIIGTQSRPVDDEGNVTFDHLSGSEKTFTIITDEGTFYGTFSDVKDGVIQLHELSTEPLGDHDHTDHSHTPVNQKNTAYYACLIIATVGIMAGMVAVVIFVGRKFSRGSYTVAPTFKKLAVITFTGVLLVGVVAGTVVVNRKKSQISNSSAAESGKILKVVTTIAQPKNVKAYGDDRVATITWEKPANANSIVGYYIRWGKQSLGVFTDSKQTIFNQTQIQPLENGVVYNVEVFSVLGDIVKKPSAFGEGDTDSFAVARDGSVSAPVALTVTPSSARVDAMRQRLNGFFDDFNTAAGAFDEKKWNFANTACVEPGEAGQFINSQFHAHNVTKSDCDRDANVSRPRAIFDITGRTEQNPGLIEMDVDGVSQPRDKWYIDIIPVDARKNGMPLDLTAHNTVDESDTEDPGRMIRINQHYDKISLSYFDENNNPKTIVPTYTCTGWGDTSANLEWCRDLSKKVAGISPIAQPVTENLTPVPNFRRHWMVQFSPQKIKLFIDGVLVIEGSTPSLFSNIKKYQIHSELFSYNTGKQYNTVKPTTSMLHWDNFGFNSASVSSIVTHNYLDGGTTGTTPLLARGTAANPVPGKNRLSKINIPDQIGSPVGKARLMFTIQPFSGNPHSYTWNTSHHVLINGKKYNLPNPALDQWKPRSGALAEMYVALPTGIFVEPADLKTGINDIQFNLNEDVLNVHIELDYNKANEPAYTQPKNIFADFNKVITPVMRANDTYWFIEQNLGLQGPASGSTQPAATVTATPSAQKTPSPTSTPIKTPSPTVKPTTTKKPTPTTKPTATVKPTPTSVNVPFDEDAVTFASPFKQVDGAIYQTRSTFDPKSGGEAKYTFTVPQNGKYIVKGVVDAPNRSKNSFYVNIDTQPNKTMVWDILPTKGFQERTVSWRGSKNVENTNQPQQVFTLTAGQHTLILKGREANTRISSVTIVKVQ